MAAAAFSPAPPRLAGEKPRAAGSPSVRGAAIASAYGAAAGAGSPADTNAEAAADPAAVCTVGKSAFGLRVRIEAKRGAKRQSVGAVEGAPICRHREALGRQQPWRTGHGKRHRHAVERLGGAAIEVVQPGIDVGEVGSAGEAERGGRRGREIAG